jgi:kinetochore protein Spc25, fungi type
LEKKIMGTKFDATLSINPPRQSFMATSNNPTMADSLPSIDFGFDDLRDRMARFTTRFDAFIAEGRKRVLEERNQFRSQMAELEGM